MIIQELAYKVTVKTDDFLHGKRKVTDEVSKLNKELARAEKERQKELKKQQDDVEKFGKSAVSAFRNVTTAAAGFLGIGAGLYGIKQLFTSTANEIVRASTQAKFFGTDVNKMFGMRRGFQQAGLNGDAFIGASGNARMALANIKDPTIFGGLTGAAQNLMVLGARTGLNINNLGDPNKALGEFTRYGKSHSQENLMQVMAAAGFDPTDAAKIKSGELKSLVDSETKKSNITAQQVREQEKLMVTLGQLDSQFTRLKTDLAIAFAPEVVNGLKAFGSWIEKNHGNIIGFFDDAGKTAKRFTEAVGGAENALKLLAAAYVGSKVTGGAVPPWLAGLVAYGTYLYNDQNNIKDSAESSLSYTKRNIGDAGRAIGFDTDFGRKPGTVMGDNIQWDIPGATETLLDAIRKVESSDGAKLYSHKGAVGEYQFMADTGREMGLRVDGQVDDRLDPEKSRAAAQIYMSKLLKKYDGNLDNALMAYNWGMGNVDKWIANGSDPAKLPKETRDYTGKIRSAMGLIDANNSIGTDSYSNYYATQTKLAASRPYQLASSGGQPQITNSTHINTVNVNSNPQSVDALNESIKRQSQRASTNAAFSSSVN
ncbi:lytic transglycosylase domain-containing protein [Salmonella enterica subsp. enterica]|uniref:lytic transglycosylase domain-containing protein n=1 Tax=Citrobacter braakii TaxID=57706 RepID=UPI00242C2DA5|nr:lytic transglycosylase domain-containing protein [Citrobacter braakii]EEJ6792713.1 lytic transglycosylase domain-containing protein [Salmonella enterica subsp. enterica]WGA83116.1 lytic transglycosylase domain-containing protein [Citrobacter braakii]